MKRIIKRVRIRSIRQTYGITNPVFITKIKIIGPKSIIIIAVAEPAAVS